MKKALILLNMGGPNNLDEVELFLKNMFNDPCILGIPIPFVRKAVASFITTKRKKQAQANYQLIGGKSPLPEHTRNLVHKLEKSLPDFQVTYAMRYTPPFAIDVLKELQEKGIEEIVCFSMYPQYSTTTTLSSFHDVKESLKQLGYTPKLHWIDRYFDHPEYNRAILERIKETLGDSHPEDYDLLFSAHGLPKRVIKKGDPYQKEVESNVEQLKTMMREEKIHFRGIHLAYQSKVGPLEWIGPSLEEKLEELAGRKVIVYPIAFTIDNSETDYELAIEHQEIAKKLGLADYQVCRCLNDKKGFVKAMEEMIKADV